MANAELIVRSPFDGKQVATLPLIDQAALDDAAATAHAAFESFQHSSAFERAKILETTAQIIQSRRAQFAETILLEAGKPIALAEAEVDRAVWTFTNAADEARQTRDEPIRADAFPSGLGHTAIIRRFPVGVVYGLTPFNFPLNLVAHKVAPAIASGNAIIIKPTPRTPLSAIKFMEALGEAGSPAGLAQVVVCANELATHLIDDPRIRFISFTGSVPIGWKINEQAAKAKKRCTLELGGNAGCIVHDDADLAQAIPMIARGAFSYGGQSCISVQRIFVHESIADDFTKRFVDHVKENIRTGDPHDRNVIVAAMIDQAAKNRVLGAIEAAKKSGAKILCGGNANGLFIEPTVITNANRSLDVCEKEIFAPVAVIDRYSDFDEAIARVNDSPFGLQAGVFTRDLCRAMRAFAQLQVGGVMINQVPTFRLENQPYGGVKDSGQGREGARYAMQEMSELRTLVIRN